MRYVLHYGYKEIAFNSFDDATAAMKAMLKGFELGTKFDCGKRWDYYEEADVKLIARPLSEPIYNDLDCVNAAIVKHKMDQADADEAEAA